VSCRTGSDIADIPPALPWQLYRYSVERRLIAWKAGSWGQNLGVSLKWKKKTELRRVADSFQGIPWLSWQFQSLLHLLLGFSAWATGLWLRRFFTQV